MQAQSGQTSGAEPVTSSQARVEYVDALRGFALFGLLMVHSAEGFGVGTGRESSDPLTAAVFSFFAGKAFAIFALLFGFGFATIMANQRARGIDFTYRFAWRLILLFAVGTLHSLLYFGDILQVLALLGLLLIPIDRVRNNMALLVIAVLLFLQIPLVIQWLLANSGNALAAAPPYFTDGSVFEIYRTGTLGDVIATNISSGFAFKWSFNWSFGRVSEIAGLFTVGMLLQRTSFFAEISESRGKAITTITIAALALLVLETFVKPLLPEWGGPDAFQIGTFTFFVVYLQWNSLASIAIQIGLLALLWNSPAKRLVGLFRLPGRMTLTLYVGHSLVAIPVLFGFGLGMWDVWSPRDMLLAGIIFFAAQIVFARWWYARYRYGPLEWTWRAATLTDWKVPMRIAPRAV